MCTYFKRTFSCGNTGRLGTKRLLYENKYSQLQIYKDKNLQNIDVKVKYIVPMKYKIASTVSLVVVGICILLLLYIRYKNRGILYVRQ